MLNQLCSAKKTYRKNFVIISKGGFPGKFPNIIISQMLFEVWRDGLWNLHVYWTDPKVGVIPKWGLAGYLSILLLVSPKKLNDIETCFCRTWLVRFIRFLLDLNWCLDWAITTNYLELKLNEVDFLKLKSSAVCKNVCKIEGALSCLKIPWKS